MSLSGKKGWVPKQILSKESSTDVAAITQSYFAYELTEKVGENQPALWHLNEWIREKQGALFNRKLISLPYGRGRYLFILHSALISILILILVWIFFHTNLFSYPLHIVFPLFDITFNCKH